MWDPHSFQYTVGSKRDLKNDMCNELVRVLLCLLPCVLSHLDATTTTTKWSKSISNITLSFGLGMPNHIFCKEEISRARFSPHHTFSPHITHYQTSLRARSKSSSHKSFPTHTSCCQLTIPQKEANNFKVSSFIIYSPFYDLNTSNVPS
jgi:hypothetical protein